MANWTRTLVLIGLANAVAAITPAARASEPSAAVFSFTNVTLRQRVELNETPAEPVAPTGAAARTGRNITIATVASVIGPDAERVRGASVTVPSVRDAAGESADVTAGDVERAIERAGVSLARVSISGPTCTVVWKQRANPDVPPAPRPPEVPLESPTVEQVLRDSVGTCRALVAHRLAELMGAPPDAVRLSFDERDALLLDEATNGRRFDVQPGALGGSGRVPVQIFVYEGDRLTRSARLNVGMTVLREVTTAVGTIDRGEVIRPEQVQIGARWQPASVKPPADPGLVVGSVAGVRIAAGRVITKTDVAPAVVVKRGQIVEVHTISGGVTLKAKARALGNARDGELVQLKLEGSDRAFTARMSGPGTAVLVVNGQE